ncbi:hypothetical protein B0H66DRAFT_537425 [Apodospora peruviana]|uniref:Uncharacterized protein n=1 Tax=Apodospora peruviana TaxID=516989 RepID=A0AAE0M111_9PEZI|nr:hypothetical protein B0H66DRAFT_537425 [Apodospora peruviana]
MYAAIQPIIALAAALLLVSPSTASTIKRQSITNLGEIQFAAPFCGNAKLHNINATDCATAVAQELAAICVNGVCKLPEGQPPFSGTQVSRTVGACEIIIQSKLVGLIPEFAEDSVANEFATFVPQCVDPSNQIHNGNPVVRSVDGQFALLFSNGLPVGPE